MKIMISTIFYLIKKKYPNFSYFLRNDVDISHFKIHKEDLGDINTLYFVSDNNLLSDLSKSKSLNLIIITSNNDFEILNKTHNIGKIDESINMHEFYEDVIDIFSSLLKWSNSLKNVILKDLSFSDIFKISENFLEHTAVIISYNLSIIAHSSTFKKSMKDKSSELFDINMEKENTENSEFLPSHIARDLIFDTEFDKCKENTEPFYFKDEAYFYYCINFFIEDVYIARLVISLNKNETYLSTGEEVIIKYISKYISLLFKNNKSKNLIKHQNDRMHNMIRSILFSEKSFAASDLSKILNTYNWKTNDKYRIVKLTFFEGSSWKNIADYICIQLESKWPEICAITSDQIIVLIININKAKSKTTLNDFFENLAYIITEYTCKAGISNFFDSFNDIITYYIQTERAIQIGQNINPDFWYYIFSDYTYSYMIEHLESEFPKEHLLHPGILELIKYDKEHNTEYLKTLEVYLKSNGNSTHSANILFIHRTSFIRRLDRIIKIANLDLNSEDEWLYLLISYKLLNI